MADSKVSALTEDTAPTSDDLTYVVNDPGGTPASRKVSLANLGKGIDHSVLATLTTGNPHTQYLLRTDTAVAAPSTPGAGTGTIYIDSTSKNLCVKDDAGVVKHGVQTQAGGGGFFVKSISDAGVVAIQQPSVGDLYDARWQPPIGMRLSASSNTYVTTSDVTGAGTLYWTPVLSGGTGVVTGYNGANLAQKTVQQKSLSLTATSGNNYNVYYDYDGDALALGAAWTNDNTPSETLADEAGAIVLSSDHTKLYLGVIRASGSNVIEDSLAKRFVWNAHNQVGRNFEKTESTDSWSYQTATIRQANGSATNQFEFVQGNNNQVLTASVIAWVSIKTASGSDIARVGVGLDSTTAFSGLLTAAYTIFGGGLATDNIYVSFTSTYRGNPSVGWHKVTWLESGMPGTSCDFVGDFGGTQCGLTGILIM